VLEELSKLPLSSSNGQSVASVILERLPSLQSTEGHPFEIQFCESLIQVWSQCLDDSAFHPIRPLIDLLDFASTRQPNPAAAEIVDELVKVTQTTADINMIPRYKSVKAVLNDMVDSNQCLRFLLDIATVCSKNADNIYRFWRCMRTDLVLLSIHASQEIEDIRIGIKLLMTSVMNDSFGPLFRAEDDQKEHNESYILNNLTILLANRASDFKLANPDQSRQIKQMKLEVLSLLACICFTTHGFDSLCNSSFAIGRMFSFLSDELDELYDHRYGYRQSAEIINNTIRILYFLFSNSEIDWRAKLRPIAGGNHKFLVVLTRLAFSDNLLIEYGIESEVLECAHEILDSCITPDEGKSILEVFNGMKE
jgi:hypothetical protein